MEAYEIDRLRMIRDYDAEAIRAKCREEGKGEDECRAVALGTITAILSIAKPTLESLIREATTCMLCGEHSDGGCHHACLDDEAIRADMAIEV